MQDVIKDNKYIIRGSKSWIFWTKLIQDIGLVKLPEGSWPPTSIQGLNTAVNDFIDIVIINKNICRAPYYQMNNNDEDRTPQEKLFLGSGVHSLIGIERLHRRLDYAISISGGRQQSLNTNNIDDDSEIQNVIRDLTYALLGSDVEIDFKSTKD